MSKEKQHGRVRALALTRQVRSFRYSATRLTVSIGAAAVVVMAAVVPVSSASASTSDETAPVKTALILGGTTVPTPDQFYLDTVRDHFIGPTQPGQVTYVQVTAPMTVWPATGISRIIWFVTGPITFGVLVARHGRTSLCGSSRDSSTPPSTSRCRAGSPPWSRR